MPTGFNRFIPKTIKRKKQLLVSAMTGVVALAVFRRLPGWDPHCLRLDDLWVATLVDFASLADLWRLHPPVPVGFVYALKTSQLIFGHKNWALQIIPVCAALIQIPLLALLVRKITGSYFWAGFAALLLAVNPNLTEHSITVKQYATDSLITVILLLLFSRCLEGRRINTFFFMMIFPLVAFLFSFTTIFLSFALIVVLLVYFWKTGQGVKGIRLYGGALLYFSGMALLLVPLVRSGNQAMIECWHYGFLPLDGDIFNFFWRRGFALFTGAFPGGLGWLALMIIPGIYQLFRQDQTKPLGYALILFLAAILAASALRKYPMGGGRTDIFSYPVTIVLFVVGLQRSSDLYRHLPAAITAVMSLIITWGVLTVHYEYYPSRACDLMTYINRTIKPNDALVVYPWTNWAAGFYGKWPVKLVQKTYSANGYYVQLDRPHTFILEGSYENLYFLTDPAVVGNQLRAVFQKDYPRIVYFAVIPPYMPHQWILQDFKQAGYIPARQIEKFNACYYLFVKNEKQ